MKLEKSKKNLQLQETEDTSVLHVRRDYAHKFQNPPNLQNLAPIGKNKSLPEPLIDAFESVSSS